jgi:hypothetical protein
MPVASATDHLAANLAALGRRNADLASMLARVKSHPTIRFEASAQEVLTATHDGRRLASAHRPLDEAQRLIDPIDLVEHAVFVVYGFGLGYHVKHLAHRLKRGGLILVFEPDLALLRAVLEQIDHSAWLRDTPVLFFTDADDRAGLATKLAGAEAIIAQGVEFIVHPPSQARLAAASDNFSATLEEFVRTAKVTLMTTLVRSIDTIRNLLLNVDHYGAGEGIEPLRDVAKGLPAVIVSAGPSLSRNIHELAKPGLRDRCVIIAVQTTLKPLLSAGIRPHFVTALDYHEISRRFYEDLSADELRDVTLVAEAKVNPVVLDVYPGPVRCCASPFLDQLLGELKRPMGELKAGATVAHLALYLARYLGCNPVALLGQDLGFTDGLYYAPLPGAAIHDVWAPELNPFNTLEMMEWQRIVRHRVHLKKFTDVNGRSIFSDMQMITYRQQFERDFAADTASGLTVIDATEGGVPKQHTVQAKLAEFLGAHATCALPAWPTPAVTIDRARLGKVRTQVERTRKDIAFLQQSARQALSILRQMREHVGDEARMAKLFTQVDRYRHDVEQRRHAFDLLEQLNQLGAFKRQRTDRKIRMRGTVPQSELQQAQIERDIDNVTWMADAATELIEQLVQAETVLDGAHGGRPARRPQPQNRRTTNLIPEAPHASRIAALVPVDLERSALGIHRSLAENFAGRTVLQATLERLGQIASIESIILIAPREADVDALIDRARINKPVEIERCDGSPFGPERDAIAAARLFAPTCWRAGIAGMSIYDEALCPQAMHAVMTRRGLSAAIIAAPDWPLIDHSEETGCEALIRRHLQQPDKLNLVFTQAPPGLNGCLVSASLMAELAQRNRLSAVGGLLIYQPHAPQPDPIARDANVQIDHRVRNSMSRATFDSARARQLLAEALQGVSDPSAVPVAQLVHRLSKAERHALLPPRHVILELCSERTSHGFFAPRNSFTINRPPIERQLAEHVAAQLAEIDDAVLTMAGAGDPLLHPEFDAIIRAAKHAGVRGVHIRTELCCQRDIIDRLLASGVDVVSVDLHADRAATYEQMMGDDRFEAVLRNIEYLVEHRARLTAHAGTAALAIPWVVPRLQRRRETLDDMDSFFDRWMHILGTAVIEGPPTFDPASKGNDGHLIPVIQPAQVRQRDARQTMTILCDGCVPLDGDDLAPDRCAGRVTLGPGSLMTIWRALRSAAQQADAHAG